MVVVVVEEVVIMVIITVVIMVVATVVIMEAIMEVVIVFRETDKCICRAGEQLIFKQAMRTFGSKMIVFENVHCVLMFVARMGGRRCCISRGTERYPVCFRSSFHLC